MDKKIDYNYLAGKGLIRCLFFPVRVYLTYVDACPCGPHISAIFHIRGGLIFGVLLPSKYV